MPKKKCNNSSSSSSESSSSSSCSSCNSSSSGCECSSESSESSECFNPHKFKQEKICPREVKTFNLETCNISFKKRVLEVKKGGKYPTIDCALEKVRPNKGGYVIRLPPGIHYITRDCCLCTDDLTIVGDDSCGFSGFFYMQGGNHNTVTDFEVCQDLCPYNKELGEGPFEVTSSNRRFMVKGNLPPNFDCLCQGRFIGIVHTDGSITQGEIIRACGNSITVSVDTGFGDTASSGEGFFFYPNVILSSGVSNIHITTTGRLTFVGVVFDGNNFTLGSSGDALILRNCVSEVKPHLHITGRYEFLCSNTFLGTLFLAPASSGSAFFQNVVGRNGTLLVDSSGFHSWKFTSVCSCQVGSRVINSGELNLKGSQFINCYQALVGNAGCMVTLYSTYFFGNTFAVFGINRCFFSSISSDNSPQTNYTPIFRENKMVFVANISTIIIVPNATIENNTNYAIIDSVLYPTIEVNFAGQYGRAYSLIIDSANSNNAQGTESDLLRTINQLLNNQSNTNTANTNTILNSINSLPNVSNNGSLLGLGSTINIA